MLAVNLLGGAALRCWWGDPGEDVRARIVEVADRLPLDGYDARLIAILAWADPVRLGPEVIERLSALRAGPARRRGARCASTAWRRPRSATSRSPPASSTRRSPACAPTAASALLAQALILRAWSGFHLGQLARLGGRRSRRARGSRSRRRSRCGRRGRARARPPSPALRGDNEAAEALAAEAERVALPAARQRRARRRPARARTRRARRRPPRRGLRAAAARLRPGRSGAPLHEEPVGARRPRRGGRAQRPPRRGARAAARARAGRRAHAGAAHPRRGCGTRGRCWRARTETRALYAAALAADLGSWPFARARLQLALRELAAPPAPGGRLAGAAARCPRRVRRARCAPVGRARAPRAARLGREQPPAAGRTRATS